MKTGSTFNEMGSLFLTIRVEMMVGGVTFYQI